jgi:hypothetical protein
MKSADSKPQGSHSHRSTRQSKVTSGSLEWKVKIESTIHVSASGFMSMSTSGPTPLGSGS